MMGASTTSQATSDEFDLKLSAQLLASRKKIQQDPQVSIAQRKDRLKRLLALVQDARLELLSALEADFGRRSPLESETIEILPLLMGIRHALSSLPGWMSYGKRSAHWATWPAKAAVDYVPLGVVGIMSPWNYPLMLSLGPAIGALAAGNRLIFKPSEAVPQTNAVLGKWMAKYFSSEECAWFEGGVDAAKSFAGAAWDHLVFTGSTAVGKQIMQRAAQAMVPVTLELGGCCPAWIDANADFEDALQSLMRGKLVNAGQTCVAPNHVYCPKSRLAELIEKAPQVARSMYPNELDDPHYTSLIHGRHAQRILAQREEAKAAGAQWVPLLSKGQCAHNCIEPGMLVDPPEHLRIVQEEIFGPVLVVKSYDDRAQPIPEAFLDEIGKRPHPLALHIFSQSSDKITKIRSLARVGMVVVNGPLVHAGQDNIPFGGLGESGVGQYHGQEGFLRFSHPRSFYQQMRPHGLDLVFPPYGKPIKEKVISLLRKFG